MYALPCHHLSRVSELGGNSRVTRVRIRAHPFRTPHSSNSICDVSSSTFMFMLDDRCAVFVTSVHHTAHCHKTIIECIKSNGHGPTKELHNHQVTQPQVAHRKYAKPRGCHIYEPSVVDSITESTAQGQGHARNPWAIERACGCHHNKPDPNTHTSSPYT